MIGGTELLFGCRYPGLSRFVGGTVGDTKRVLVVEDVRSLRRGLSRALEEHSVAALEADCLEEARAFLSSEPGPLSGAILDVRLPDGCGTELLPEVRRHSPEARVIFWTGYGSLTGAVATIKRGAADYLPKSADLAPILAALEGQPVPVARERLDLPVLPLQALEWEYIQMVLDECGGNKSAAARKLCMARSALQRKLKNPPPGYGG